MRVSRDVSFSGKLHKLIPLLGSDKPGEVLATVAAIDRSLKSVGADWHALAAMVAGQPQRADECSADWRDIVDECLRANWRLSPKERAFLSSLGNFSSLSVKQAKWLADISRRVRHAA